MGNASSLAPVFYGHQTHSVLLSPDSVLWPQSQGLPLSNREVLVSSPRTLTVGSLSQKNAKAGVHLRFSTVLKIHVFFFFLCDFFLSPQIHMLES